MGGKGAQDGCVRATAYAANKRTALRGARDDQWVSSRDDIQARLFLEDCKLWAKAMDVAARALGEVVLDPKEKHSAYVLRFPNDRRIHSMSSNPDAQAGKRGGRILAEFALHPELRKLWSLAYHGLLCGGLILTIPTPSRT